MTLRPIQRPRRCPLGLEALEARCAPATLVNAQTVTYQDADGDTVRVAFSRPFLTPAIVNSVFTFDTGSVDDSNAAKQQLQRITLPDLAAAAGTSITTVAVRSPVNGGDGYAHVGEIVANGIDLGAVTVDGDLGRVRAGDTTTATSGLKGLTVHSLGRYGTATGATDLNTEVQGKLDFLKVKSDIRDAGVTVTGGANGKIGPITVGGSIVEGRVFAGGDIGNVSIKGSVNAGQLWADGKLANVTIGGSLRGGIGLNSGVVYGKTGVGAVKVTGDVVGSSGEGSGTIFTNAGISSVAIGGSLWGGDGFGSGDISTGTGALGPVKVAGDVHGGSGMGSGQIYAGTTMAAVIIGGSVRGGPGDFSGSMIANGAATTVTIQGNLVGGSAAGAADLTHSGYLQAKRIANLKIGGSLVAGVDNTTGTFLNNGAVRVSDDLRKVTIGGDMLGNVTSPAIISARGQAAPSGAKDQAIGSLTVGGRVEHALILAGYDTTGFGVNADAQIGTVVVDGDWIASSLVAGAASTDGAFGDANDFAITGGKDVAAVSSKIGSVTIGGQAMGTLGGTDHSGIVAQNIGAVKIGDTTILLTAGNGNDDFFVGITGDFKVNEI